MPIHLPLERLTLNCAKQKSQQKHQKIYQKTVNNEYDFTEACNNTLEAPIGIPYKKSEPIAITVARSVPNQSFAPTRSLPDCFTESSTPYSNDLSKSGPPAFNNLELAKPSFRRLSSILGQSEGFDMLTEEWEEQERLDAGRNARLGFPSPPLMNLTFFCFQDDQGNHENNNQSGIISKPIQPIPITVKSPIKYDSFKQEDKIAEYAFQTPEYNITPFKSSSDAIPKLDFDQFQSMESGFCFDAIPQQFDQGEQQLGSPQLQAIEAEQKNNRAILNESLDLHGYGSLSPAQLRNDPTKPPPINVKTATTMDIMRGACSPSPDPNTSTLGTDSPTSPSSISASFKPDETKKPQRQGKPIIMQVKKEKPIQLSFSFPM